MCNQFKHDVIDRYTVLIAVIRSEVSQEILKMQKYICYKRKLSEETKSKIAGFKAFVRKKLHPCNSCLCSNSTVVLPLLWDILSCVHL